MLVSAAMAERPRAAVSGKSRPASTSPAPAAARHSTARVATTQGRGSELPGWFWTALGCMTVLVVGLTVVFFVFQPSAAPAAPGEAAAAPLPAAVTTTVVPSAPARAAEAPRPPAQGIRVERMATPPPAIDQIPAAPALKPRAPARPVKVARTPAAKPAAAAKPAPAESEGEANEEELLKPKQRPAATAQDDDSEEK
jgi:hypothetical protein